MPDNTLRYRIAWLLGVPEESLSPATEEWIASAADLLVRKFRPNEAREFRPDVVLLDIGLPGIDGFEIARRIRAMPRLAAIRLIAITGYGQSHDKARALEVGFDAHVVKPVQPEMLQGLLAPR